MNDSHKNRSLTPEEKASLVDFMAAEALMNSGTEKACTCGLAAHGVDEPCPVHVDSDGDTSKPCHAVGSCGAHEALGPKECETCRNPQKGLPPKATANALSKEETELVVDALKFRVTHYRLQHEAYMKGKARIRGGKPQEAVAWIDRFEARVNAVIAKLESKP